MPSVKWYDSFAIDETPIISSRVRLARNLKKYPFSAKISDEDSLKMIADVVSSVKNDYMAIGESFNYVDLSKIDSVDKQSMVEKHEISPELLRYNRPKGVLVKDDESVDIMINEEDHIRIQAIYPGKSIEKAYDLANKIDDVIGESLEYAFMKDYGYLTSCPSNTGTGLRASVMVHLPMLETTENLQTLVGVLAKVGMTIRGLYGEGSKSYGSIYQISNQVTLGRSEQDVISGLNSITESIMESEYRIQKGAMEADPLELENSVFRSLGALCYARKMDLNEAMMLLSAVRFGYMAGVAKGNKPAIPFYHIMMNIEPGNLQKAAGYPMNESQLNIARADYLRTVFK